MQPGIFNLRFLAQEIPFVYVTDAEQAQQVLDKFMTQDVLFGIDTETEALPQYNSRPKAALSPFTSKIRLIQVFNGKAAVVFDMKQINATEIFLPFLESKKFVAHNALFDLKFFMCMGVKSMNIGCTYLLFKVLNHAYSAEELRASLEACVKNIFKVDILKKAQTSDWSVPDLTYEQVEYSALDAICVLKLAEKLAVAAEKYGLVKYYKLCKDAQHPIAHMELSGLHINRDMHIKLIDDWRAKMYAAKVNVQKLTGIDSITSHKVAAWLGENLDTRTLAIWPRTDTGKLKTDSHAFSDFSYLPIVTPFSEFQHYEKLATSFGMNLLRFVNPETDRIHPYYRICGARTGRLSCSEPNTQQLPRGADVRNMFIPSEGNVFVCADYSQIELRVAAEVSQDEVMLKAYRDGIDLHTLTASVVSGKPLEDVTKTDRQKAKAINFGFLFGLGAKKFSHYAKKSYKTEVTEEEAQEAIETFRTTYSGYYEWQMNQATVAARSLTVKTPYGKIRKLDPQNTYGTAMNTPVQGGAAECMLHAMIKLHSHIVKKGVNVKIINCVHDELLLECPPSEVKIASKLLKLSMEQGFLEVFPKGCTKGIAEVGVGNSWGEAKV